MFKNGFQALWSAGSRLLSVYLGSPFIDDAHDFELKHEIGTLGRHCGIPCPSNGMKLEYNHKEFKEVICGDENAICTEGNVNAVHWRNIGGTLSVLRF